MSADAALKGRSSGSRGHSGLRLLDVGRRLIVEPGGLYFDANGALHQTIAMCP